VEGGDISVSTHVGRGASEGYRIGQYIAGQWRERTLSLRRHDRLGYGSVYHVVPQRVQYELEPEVRTSIRAVGGGGIGGVLFMVDRAIRSHFVKQPRPDDVQSVVIGASTGRGLGR
jgi:hypothetical protein